MNISPRCDELVRMTNERYEQENDIVCAICGYGIFRGDAVAWDKNNQICHAECAKKEDRMEITMPNKPSVLDWTAREMHEFCAARVAIRDGDCMGVYAKECPLYEMCCECPDQWGGAQDAQ